MTQPTEAPARAARPVMVCAACGAEERSIRYSPLNRQDPVCRACYRVQQALQAHPVQNTEVVALTQEYVEVAATAPGAVPPGPTLHEESEEEAQARRLRHAEAKEKRDNETSEAAAERVARGESVQQ